MYVQLKPGAKGRVELKNGSIYVGARPGEVVDVDQKQFDLAIGSGRFEPAKKPVTPATSEPAEKTGKQARSRKNKKD